MALKEFYGVFIAVEGDTVLLPNVAVAEVVAHGKVGAVDGAPPWWLGHIDWNGARVPLVSLEALNGKTVPQTTRRSRIAVINTPGRELDVGQIAFLCQGYPHLVTLNRAAMAAEALDPDDNDDLVLARTRIANTRAMIPDLESIERQIHQARDAIAVVA